MNQLLKLLSTAAADALDVWVGIITGIALGLSPALSGALSIASALAGVTLVVAAGKRLRHLIYRSRRLAKRRERIERVWKRYGIPGVALQAPLLTGAAACDPPCAGARRPSSSPAVVDAGQRGVVGLGTHRSGGPGLLDIRTLATSLEPPRAGVVLRTPLLRTRVYRARGRAEAALRPGPSSSRPGTGRVPALS